MSNITSKSTKSQILKAYNDLLKAYKSLEKEAKAVTTDDGPAPSAAVSVGSGDISIADIIRALNGLADNFGDAARTLQHKLTTEATALSELRGAIAGHVKHLKELHDIEAGEGTLDELLKGYSEAAKAGAEELKDKKEALRAELDEKKAAWKKEQDEHSRATKEARDQLKKSRQREAAEYQYERDQKVAAENDAREQARKAFEAELVSLRETKAAAWAEREKSVAEREAEYAELQAKKEGHEVALAAAVKKATDEGTGVARRQAKVAADLQAKENDGKRRVFELRIASLEETIRKQAAQIASLDKQLSTALSQAQNLAVKAIEGASNATSFDAIREIAMEQAKHSGKGK
jgi:chromosome segregation ATPase